MQRSGLQRASFQGCWLPVGVWGSAAGCSAGCPQRLPGQASSPSPTHAATSLWGCRNSSATSTDGWLRAKEPCSSHATSHAQLYSGCQPGTRKQLEQCRKPKCEICLCNPCPCLLNSCYANGWPPEQTWLLKYIWHHGLWQVTTS